MLKTIRKLETLIDKINLKISFTIFVVLTLFILLLFSLFELSGVPLILLSACFFIYAIIFGGVIFLKLLVDFFRHYVKIFSFISDRLDNLFKLTK